MSNERENLSVPSGLPSTIGFTLLGAFLGAATGGDDEMLFGAILGFLLGRFRLMHIHAKSVASHLEFMNDRIDWLERTAGEQARSAAEAGPGTPTPAPAPDATTTAPPSAPEAGATTAPPTPTPPSPIATPPRVSPEPRATPPRPTRPVEPPAPTAFDRAVAAARDMVFGGNTVVRGGILVLLVGVTLLARWAADNALFPVEARLALAALIGLALTVVGFTLRETRPSFGTTLQGGGLAALYVVCFIAYRLFELVPVGMAFGLFIVVAAAGGALAVLQRSLPLIVIASLGGFLAPILASTGSGNHVALFSYYLVLNASIAAIAFARSWRVLNILAFVCTYGVATTWGVLSYEPEKLASTLPFVFAFMLLFTGEALLFAWRQPPKLKGLVDGTLVFGTPLVTLLALARVLSEVEMGLAIATSAMALFYAAIAVWLWRTAPDTLRQLSEAFVALGIGLATMAVPFAFEDSPTTAIIWALEGAGIHWIGVRQGRRLARATGLALQPLGALAFFIWLALDGTPADQWLANGRFLSAVSLAFAGFAISREADTERPHEHSVFWILAQAAGVWGLGWWIYGVGAELGEFAPDRFVMASMVAVLGLTAVALEGSARALAWRAGRLGSLLLLPVAALGLIEALEVEPSILAGGGWLAWPLCLAGLYYVVRAVETEETPWTERAHAAWLWLAAGVAAAALNGLADDVLGLGYDWLVAGVGLGLVAVAAGTLKAVEREIDAFGRQPRNAVLLGAGPVLAASIAWAFVSNVAGEGATRPLPYLPLLNPVDITVAFIALTALRWWRSLFWVDAEELFEVPRQWLAISATVFGFAWLNAILVRSVVQWAGVPHRAEALWDSTPLQVCLSIAWTLVGFAGMWLSTRTRQRKAWMAFAGLLGVTVVKLFVVDLSQLTTGAKIGTFLVVGVLLLLVGYLSPVPPDSIDGGDDGDGEGGGPTGGQPDDPAPGDGAPPSSVTTVKTPTTGATDPRALVVWLLLVPLAGVIGSGPARAVAPEVPEPLRLEDFAWSRPIDTRASGVIQVIDVPYALYLDSVEPGLADLRVFDADGQAVPHAVAEPARAEVDAPTVTPLPLYRMPEGTAPEEVLLPGSGYQVNVGHRAGRTTVQLDALLAEASTRPPPLAYLVDTSDIEGEIVALEFDLAPMPEDYLTALRIDATDDLVKYRTLRRKAVVAQLAGADGSITQRRVPLSRVRAKYVRVTWPADEGAPVILGISAVQQPPRPERARSRHRVSSMPGVSGESTESPQPGVHVFDLGGFVPVDRLQVDLGSGRALVSAQVARASAADGPWRRVFHGYVYQLDRGSRTEPDDDGRNPPIDVDGRRMRFYRVAFDAKGGGAGRPAPALEISWPTEQLYFVAQGRAPYTLAVGKAGAPSARFDAAQLFAIGGEAARAKGPTPATARLGKRAAMRGEAALEPEKESPARKIALWGVLLTAVAIVAMMALRLIREMNASTDA